MEPAKACTIICATAALHNICIITRVPLPLEDLGLVAEEMEGPDRDAEGDVTRQVRIKRDSLYDRFYLIMFCILKIR